MSNAIVTLRYTVDLPEDVVERIAGSSDDGSEEWFGAAYDKVAERLRDEGHEFMDYVTGDPDVDVTM